MPAEMLGRDKIVSTIKRVYESYGFAPLATPSIEFRDILTCGGGEEANKELYLFTDPDKNEVGLPYELTVSLARVVAQYPELPIPFKRYQVQSVWRYDKPDPGRYREFIQFDIDTVGSASMSADAEIICAMHDSLSALNLPFRIRLNNRKLLNAMILYCGLSEEMGHPVLRVLDKLDKQGLEAIKLELGQGRVDTSGDKIKGVGLSDSAILKIEQFITIQADSRTEMLEKLTAWFNGFEPSVEALSELRQIVGILDSLSIAEERVVIDPTIARGLAYYTGPVFEAVLVGSEEMGSVLGGGRYDKRVGMFSETDMPAVGASIGVDRLLAVMTRLGKIQTRPSTADVLITVMAPERMNDYFRIAGELRSAGIRAEVWIGGKKGVKQQLKYADKKEIPIALFIGEDEFTTGTVSIKDLRVGKETTIETEDRQSYLTQRVAQKTVPMAELVGELKSWLAD